jgi:glycosyltransferase involved in cell wall biosynthesis
VIISTTITNSRADVIEAALSEFHPHVDQCIVIDTGATDDTMRIARQVLAGTQKFRPRKWAWRNDFSAARNQALAYARELIRLGGREPDAQDWIVTADTDERLRIQGAREFLATVPAEFDVVMVPHATRTYSQCRFIRATSKGEWCMPVHEYFHPYRSVPGPAGWEFQCQPRPDEDRTAKYTHYRAVLESLVEREPDNARAFYYLGDTLAILGYKGASIKAFARCGELPGWNEQASWARYRSAILQFELGLGNFALESCIQGIARSPMMAELYWLAGWICYQGKDYAAAANFAEAALRIGPKPRAGFCYPQAQKELPEQLLRYAQAQLAGQPIEGLPQPIARPA